MRWQDIPGFFDFQKVYDLAPVFSKNNKFKFLEIGSFLGKSTMYMYELLKSKNIDMDFNIIDTFTGPINGEWTDQDLWKSLNYDPNFSMEPIENFYTLFKDNMGEAINEINVFTVPAIEVVDKFPDNYFDFVFIDGDHQIESVYSDISSCYPKVRIGGLLGGHDWPGCGHAPEKEQNSIKLGYDKYFANNEYLNHPFIYYNTCPPWGSWFIVKPEN